MEKKKKHIGFKGLEEKVEREEIKEGKSKKVAKRIAGGTAYKVECEKKMKKK